MISAREEKSRYYGDFRGVDFSSDHTQVLDQRLAYSVNMYKDYQSGNGGGIETIPGFRRIVDTLDKEEIYAIHSCKFNIEEREVGRVLIHAGKNLYLLLDDISDVSTGVSQEKVVEVPEAKAESTNTYEITVDFKLGTILAAVKTYNGDLLDFVKTGGDNYEESKCTYTITFSSNAITKGDFVILSYVEMHLYGSIWAEMAQNKSESFVFNNKLYIIDGKNYLVYDGTSISNALDNAYIPTTYKNIIPAGENADAGMAYEERNILQPKFKNTFYADGTNLEFTLSERWVDLDKVIVYGSLKEWGTDYGYDSQTGTITFKEGKAPPAPSEKICPENYITGYPENYAGVEITASKPRDSSVITKCKISAIFDDRVFLSGNPDNPNIIYFCGRSNVTGFTDPTYFPETNFVRDGVGAAGITGLIPVADTLMALKAESEQDGAVYYHRENATGEDLHPKDYPSARGLSGIGCLGACTNFLDDPVFVSKRGLEGISKLQIASERSIEHRSSLIDAKLVNIGAEALKNAKLEEWNGYLLLLVDGKIFMADSRQRYADSTGAMQYEWYYLEDIGVYNGGWSEYVYDDTLPHELINTESNTESVVINGKTYGLAVHPTPNVVANPDNETISSIDEGKRRFYFKLEDGKAYICKATGAKIGGTFVKATTLKVIDNNILFGTPNGVICSFNFDQRNEYGEIPSKYYNFDGRTIFSGAATKMDSCGIPHLTKNTIKKSTVIKTKAIPSSTVKVKVRTNVKPYEQVARISSSRFDFDDVDFADFSFVVTEDTIFSIKEKEKKWVEKQYFLYSDEYCKPLSLFYISYRYTIVGRIK